MKSPRLKRFLQNAALSIISLGLCFAVLEVALRFAGYGNLEIYEADPILYWKLKPRQKCYTKVDRKPVRVNSHGTRGPEFTTAKPPNTVRILAVGDSKTFGWGLEESETYPAVLESLLREKTGPGRRIEVINAGVNAYSYPQMHAYFKNVALKYSPDMLIICNGNLWTQFSSESSPEFVKKFMMRVRLKNFLRRFAIFHYVVEVKLRRVYESQRTKFIPVDPKQDTLFREQQAADPHAFLRKSLDDLCRLAITNGVKPVLLYMPRLTELQSGDTNNADRANMVVSPALNVPFVDIAPAFASNAEQYYLEADPVHVNAAGNRIIARKLLESVAGSLLP